MSPEAQRIAIAEACGWTSIMESPGFVDSRPFPRGASPGTDIRVHGSAHLPDYLNSFDAIFGAILSRSIEDQWAIFATLCNIVEAGKPAYTGTPAEYSKAFLQTLSLWTD